MIEKRDVVFESSGLKLSGHLYVPPREGALPGVVLSGPFTGVKEQVVGTYARQLAEHGYVTLAFDHRNFGESEGQPRQHEDSAGKLADLQDALSFLATLKEVDPARLASVGVCLGASYILRASAFDPRVKAVALIAGGYLSPENLRRLMGAGPYREILQRFSRIRQQQFETGTVEYMPAVGLTGPEPAMQGPEPFEYYDRAKSSAPHWENRVTRLSQASLFTLEGATASACLGPTPVLFVHGRKDLYCRPEDAQSTFDRVDGPKEILWLDTTNHIDLYDRDEYVRPAVARTVAWFAQHLVKA